MDQNIEQPYSPNKLTNEFIRETYNTQVRNQYKNNYEFNRWFSSDRNRADYVMTYRALTHHFQRTYFNNILEIGPGPGTWTKIAYRRNSKAKFDLVDISRAMKEQFTLEMRKEPNVNYIVSDIAAYSPSIQYECVMSIRAFEYFEDKEGFINNVYNLLAEEGSGIIVTKNSNYGFPSRKDGRLQHSGQMAPEEMRRALSKQGFRNIEIYPAVIRVPLSAPVVNSMFTRIAERIFNRTFTSPLSAALIPFTESYLVFFSK